MANIPCPNVSRCDCDNSPLGNFSSEAPDELTYYAMSWITPKPRMGQNPDDAVGPGRPPVTCGSTTSPTAAQQCADRDSYINGNNNITPNLPVVLNSTVSCVAFCPDGSFTIGTSDPGTFVNQDSSVANGQAQAEACRLAVTNRICLSNISGQACVGTLFSVQVVASSTSPVTFSIITGALPPGVIIVPLSPTSIFLAGVPTTAGNYSFNLRAANTSGFTAIKAYTISVMGIVNDSPLAEATEGDAYVAIITAAGGTAPYSFGVVVGALPAGLSLDPSGLLQGTPTADGDFNFTIEVTDSAAQTCRKAFSLHVAESATCPAFVASFASIPIQTVQAAKDTTYGLVLCGFSQQLRDADTGALIAPTVIDHHVTCWIPTLSKFCGPGNISASRAFNFVDPTGAENAIGDRTDCNIGPDYAADDDTVYCVGYDSGTNDQYIVGLDCVLELVTLKVNLGVKPGLATTRVAYSPTPKCILIPNIDNTDRLSKYSLPGCVLQGQVDLFSFPYAQFLRGLIYHPTRQKFYATAASDPLFHEILVEIDPTTLAISNTHDFGPGATGTMTLDYRPGNGWIFAKGAANLYVFDPDSWTEICTIALPNNSGAAFDQKTGNLFSADFAAQELDKYH